MKKATVRAVAAANMNSYSLPREVSIEITIWQLRIERAKSHSDQHLPSYQNAIQSMEEWILLLPVRRFYQ